MRASKHTDLPWRVQRGMRRRHTRETGTIKNEGQSSLSRKPRALFFTLLRSLFQTRNAIFNGKLLPTIGFGDKKIPVKACPMQFSSLDCNPFFSSRLIKNRHINENSIFIGCSVFEIWIVGVLEVINGSGKTNKTRKQWKYKRARITIVNYFAMNTRSGWRMLNCSRGNSVNIHFKYEFNWTKFLARISSASLRRCSSRRIINLYC